MKNKVLILALSCVIMSMLAGCEIIKGGNKNGTKQGSRVRSKNEGVCRTG